MIGVGINYWSDFDGIKRALDTIPNDWYTIVINGEYPNRYDDPTSSPEMEDALFTKNNVHHIRLKDPQPQIVKRNMYWEIAQQKGLDWLIVLDSDEYLEVDQRMFELSLNHLEEEFSESRCFPIYNLNMGFFVAAPRLFRAPFNYRHKDLQKEKTINHGSIWDGDHDVIQDMYVYYMHRRRIDGLQPENACVPYIKMYHDKALRDKKRVDADYLWYSENPNR